jgi:hypothetical protein
MEPKDIAIMAVKISAQTIRWHARLIMIGFLLGPFCSSGNASSGYVPHEGDILFQTSRSSQSRAIQLATHSRWSHMGMIYLKNGRPYVLEAVQPVRLTPLPVWVARGVKQHFTVRRLRDARTRLTAKTLARMHAIGAGFLGRSYDQYFEWSDKRLYCSELVWKVYRRGAGIRLGNLQELGSFDLGHPAVRAKLRERYGAQPPMHEAVVSPADIYNASQLITVYRQ